MQQNSQFKSPLEDPALLAEIREARKFRIKFYRRREIEIPPDEPR
jgi:hypothetical protein